MAAGELAQKAADAGQRRAVLDQETYAEQVGKFGGRTPEHVQDEMGVLAGEFGVMDQLDINRYARVLPSTRKQAIVASSPVITLVSLKMQPLPKNMTT